MQITYGKIRAYVARINILILSKKHGNIGSVGVLLRYEIKNVMKNKLMFSHWFKIHPHDHKPFLLGRAKRYLFIYGFFDVNLDIHSVALTNSR